MPFDQTPVDRAVLTIPDAGSRSSLGGLVAGPAPHPSEFRASNAAQDALVTAILELTSAERQVLMLAATSDCSHEEVADRLGMHDAHVMLLMRTGLLRLGRAMRPSMSVEPDAPRQRTSERP
jgi:DNA-directed RNA polymerase specialized sigma24 family protein